MVDATGVAPSPLELKSRYELAEISKFAESGRSWEIVDRDIFDSLECCFMGLPLVRQHHVAIERLHFPLDACSVELSNLDHRGPQHIVHREFLECCCLLCFVVEATGVGVNEHTWHMADSLLHHFLNFGGRINVLTTKLCPK